MNFGYRILAALCFFTRLPFWRIANVGKEYYERVVPMWPMVGWLTGGVMGLVAWLTMGLPVYVSAVLCLIVRVLITGALHEDGFADFCDGFGGGTSKGRTLEIMKDSHIGTYGVLGLILYFMLMVTAMGYVMEKTGYPLQIMAVMIIGNSMCKWVASSIIYFLPYARKEEEAKTKLVYASVSVGEKIMSAVFGLLPIGIMLCFTPFFVDDLICALIAMVVVMATAAYLFRLMHKRIEGYTGDCCGATFIVCEAVYYLILVCLL